MAIKNILVLLISLAVASVGSAKAQKPRSTPLVGMLIAGSPSSMATRIDTFQQRLHELGYTEGRNIGVEYHYASGNYDRITAITDDLVRSKAEVIVTWAISGYTTGEECDHDHPGRHGGWW